MLFKALKIDRSKAIYCYGRKKLKYNSRTLGSKNKSFSRSFIKFVCFKKVDLDINEIHCAYSTPSSASLFISKIFNFNKLSHNLLYSFQFHITTILI